MRIPQELTRDLVPVGLTIAHCPYASLINGSEFCPDFGSYGGKQVVEYPAGHMIASFKVCRWPPVVRWPMGLMIARLN